MRSKGISSRGFKRLAHLVKAQAWGGDTLVVTSTKHYTPPDGMGTTLGAIVEFSDGARGYYNMEDPNNIDLVVVDPQGQTTRSSEQVEGTATTHDAYSTAWAEYGSSASQGVLSMSEQEEFNSALGTSYEVFEPTEEDIQAWTEGLEGAF